MEYVGEALDHKQFRKHDISSRKHPTTKISSFPSIITPILPDHCYIHKTNLDYLLSTFTMFFLSSDVIDKWKIEKSGLILSFHMALFVPIILTFECIRH